MGLKSIAVAVDVGVEVRGVNIRVVICKRKERGSFFGSVIASVINICPD